MKTTGKKTLGTWNPGQAGPAGGVGNQPDAPLTNENKLNPKNLLNKES